MLGPFNEIVHELHGLALQIGRAARHVAEVIPAELVGVNDERAVAIGVLRCAVDEVALSAADTANAGQEAIEAAQVLRDTIGYPPRYDASNPPATTRPLRTATSYEAMVEGGAQAAFERWRGDHPGDELTDPDTIVTLRVQARMIVDDIDSSQWAESARWIAGDDD